MSMDNDLTKIKHALDLAKQVVSGFTSGRIEAELKAGGDPVTAADLELDKVIESIKKEKAKTVCIQLADGLKPRATEIVDYIKSKVDRD